MNNTGKETFDFDYLVDKYLKFKLKNLKQKSVYEAYKKDYQSSYYEHYPDVQSMDDFITRLKTIDRY